MNKIIREHYPASRLPADLRDAIGAAEQVTITIVTEEDATRHDSASNQQSWFERHKHIRRNYYQTDAEVIEYVRALRDEWSHRER
ncbi:MAG: hypothetical protein HYS06_10775 [Methylocystis sp.]|nr:hypothetical protein [Methylocystis sp.]MBI3274930.1 hypothetical protein [Methylocystis sp.]